ncbi:MAG: extracellular solute-binding protein [Prosthecobacter sp.]|jgi:ABC-type Fe3+ transport system substrate-binding protein|nr:extracellular solute-binding protein [Prosthecobacter sp.]
MGTASILFTWRKEAAIATALLATLVAPYWLKPVDSTAPARYDRRLVIITPHHELIREEFGRAFAREWKARTGQVVFIDWRVPGGTSEIAVMLKSEYTAAFQQHWTQVLGNAWSPQVAQAFLNAKAAPTDPARAAFLASRVGIGADLFFGGGAFDFQLQAEAGTLVSESGPGTGLAGLRAKHPTWFSEGVIPEKLGGEPFRDAQDRWCGACLSSFGIVFNRDVLRRLGIEKDPQQWSDLADPRLQGMVALADPGRSSSVTKAFEMLIQQQMQEELARISLTPGTVKPEQQEAEAVRRGWLQGLSLIQRISANARYFSDTSTKIPLDVLRGDAAAGMCIDFYGRSAEESVRKADGSSRVGFIMPVGGTSISVDPIALLRGAPDPELATAFMEFVLSEKGQTLWGYRAGQPGGPEKLALRRLPVRRDLYQSPHVERMSDGGEMPYEKARAFSYRSEWTGAVFSSLRFLLRVLCVDTHEEQRLAWRHLTLGGFPPHATSVFHELNRVRYEEALGGISALLRSRDKVAETRLARELGEMTRRNYLLAAKLARQGE